MMPEVVNSTSKMEVDSVELVAFKPTGNDFEDFTFVLGGQRVQLSLWHSESDSDLGWRFVEQQCWRTYLDMLRVVGPFNVGLVFDVRRV